MNRISSILINNYGFQFVGDFYINGDIIIKLDKVGTYIYVHISSKGSSTSLGIKTDHSNVEKKIKMILYSHVGFSIMKKMIRKVKINKVVECM